MPATATPKAKDVFLIGEIDNDSAKEFMIALRDVHEKTPPRVPIRIVMSCEGGDMELSFGIMSLINEIKRHGRKVITHVAGGAYSAAAIILQAGTHRTIESFGYIMTHLPWVDMDGWKGTTDQLDEYRAQTVRLGRMQIELFADRAGFTVEEIENIFFIPHQDVYFGAEIAKQYNLVDEVLA